MVDQKDLKSLTKGINIGGGSFGTGWVSSIETSGTDTDGLELV